LAGYADFTILLDDPAQTPGLGFNAYADALADIVARSRAEFAVGIFGTWGSGKTTLDEVASATLSRYTFVIGVVGRQVVCLAGHAISIAELRATDL
jgi:ABC-type polysaccharide/polyol phosphate transport system ATPase subunit